MNIRGLVDQAREKFVEYQPKLQEVSEKLKQVLSTVAFVVKKVFLYLLRIGFCLALPTPFAAFFVLGACIPQFSKIVVDSVNYIWENHKILLGLFVVAGVLIVPHVVLLTGAVYFGLEFGYSAFWEDEFAIPQKGSVFA